MKPFLDFMVDIRPEGLEHVPREKAAILVGNHRSDMDPFIVASAIPRYISWIAAEYTTRIPIFKNLIRDTGVIPMDIHGNVTVSSIKKLMHVLKKGEILGIFPEGHDYMVKNDFTAPMAPFHAGFATFALRSNVPIIPFVIVPVEEDIETIPFPPAVRSFFGLPEEVCKIPNRVNYRAVRIIFTEPLDIAPYKAMNEVEAVDAICQKTRERMSDIQHQTGMLIKEVA